jgi:hypothetical protein
MGYGNRTCNVGIPIKGTGEAHDFSRREREVRSQLKALFGEIRHMAFADLCLSREPAGPFDRNAVLLAMLVHGLARCAGSIHDESMLRRSVTEGKGGMRWGVITAPVRRSRRVTICGARLSVSPRRRSSRRDQILDQVW